MQNKIIPSEAGSLTSFLFTMLPASLSGVPFHQNTEAITRYVAKGFPVHIAVYEVSPVVQPPAVYTHPHVHEDCDEINIILSTGKLVYNIRLGEEEYRVGNNASVWIPRGMVHAANVVQGSGYFVTIRVQ